jgi:transcriptional regulator with XRE-family HTH domain
MAADIVPGPVVERIEARLDRMDMPLDAALEAAGLPHDFLDKLRLGKTPIPRGKRLLKLAEALGTSVSYLVGLDPDVEPPQELLEEDQGSFDMLAGDEEVLLRAYSQHPSARHPRLATSEYWPFAVLVFFASIIVPLFKLLGLSTLLITTQRGTPSWLREHTLIYRVVDSIGRWSMIDVFMVSILSATVRMGRLGSVFPGLGAVAFGAVVVLTMLAAHSFDLRLMWDAARRNERPGQATRCLPVQ